MDVATWTFLLPKLEKTMSDINFLPGFCKVILIGTIGHDLELKCDKNGKPMCILSLAVSEEHIDRNGEKVKKTNWFNVLLFGKNAEFGVKHLIKGCQVCIEGTLRKSGIQVNVVHPLSQSRNQNYVHNDVPSAEDNANYDAIPF